jgi:rhodanese-related sulfurtransferase
MTLIFQLHLLLTAFVIVASTLFFTAASPAHASAMIAAARDASACDAADCLTPGQLITAAEAREMKRRLGGRALLVDIRNRREAPPKPWSDVQVPFVLPTPAALANAGSPGTHVEFRIDFADNIDNALRAAHLRHDEPLVLVAPSGWSGVLAALLAREHGYSNVFVVCD